MTINSMIRLLVVGPTLFWWMPCFFTALGTHVWLCLVWPFLGFYPGPTGSGPGYSEASMGIWGCLSLLGFAALAFHALRKNSLAIAITCALLISLSSLTLIGRAYWGLTHLDLSNAHLSMAPS
jgi:hypothetical protein